MFLESAHVDVKKYAATKIRNENLLYNMFIRSDDDSINLEILNNVNNELLLHKMYENCNRRSFQILEYDIIRKIIQVKTDFSNGFLFDAVDIYKGLMPEICLCLNNTNIKPLLINKIVALEPSSEKTISLIYLDKIDLINQEEVVTNILTAIEDTSLNDPEVDKLFELLFDRVPYKICVRIIEKIMSSHITGLIFRNNYSVRAPVNKKLALFQNCAFQYLVKCKSDRLEAVLKAYSENKTFLFKQANIPNVLVAAPNNILSEYSVHHLIHLMDSMLFSHHLDDLNYNEYQIKKIIEKLGTMGSNALVHLREYFQQLEVSPKQPCKSMESLYRDTYNSIKEVVLGLRRD